MMVHFTRAILTATAAVLLSGCYTPKDSQLYFSKAADEDPSLEPIHRTPLYTVYWDHAISRCVLHSAHTWGESGGGAGGTGVGVSVFSCDPSRIKARRDQIEELIRRGGAPSLPPPASSIHKKDPGAAEHAGLLRTPSSKRPAATPKQPEEPPPNQAPTQPVVQ